MGVNKNSIYTIRYAAKHGVNFDHMVTIGRQGCHKITGKEIKKRFPKEKQAEIIEYLTAEKTMYAEKIFQCFGAKKVDSIDYSDYEQATIIHDMNLPIGENMKNKFSCVWDGGTLEHVFNFPTAIRNCMDMVQKDGHLILETPANNFFGHGFYQFSPELFFSLLDKQNGFMDTKIFIQGENKHWHEVVSPQIIKRRVDLCCTQKAASMVVISKKINDIPNILSVFQSDYVNIWNETEKTKQPTIPKILLLYKKLMPQKIRKFLSKPIEYLNHQKKIKQMYIPIDITN